MTSRNLRYVGLMIQSSAVFVALSTLLGRIYFLEYFKELGIPHTESRLNVIDYAVIAPDVTIIGIGVSLVYPVIIMWSTAVKIPARLQLHTLYFALFLILLSVLLPLANTELVPSVQSYLSRLGIYGLWKSFIVAVSLTAGVVYGAGLTAGVDDTSSNGEGKLLGSIRRNSRVLRLVLPMVYIAIAIYVALTTINSAVTLAERDARDAIQNSPSATLELSGGNVSEALREMMYTNCVEHVPCKFRVLLIGEKFIYLRPQEIEDQRKLIYAVLLRDISAVTYVHSQ